MRRTSKLLTELLNPVIPEGTCTIVHQPIRELKKWALHQHVQKKRRDSVQDFNSAFPLQNRL
ncbi:hypothetical protein J6590_105822, partial [Homalodisca vitripennis]